MSLGDRSERAAPLRLLEASHRGGRHCTITKMIGRSAMEALHPSQASAAKAAQQDFTELARRIGKLRWLGMQQEAEELQMMLRRVPHTDCVVLVPRDTD